MQHSWFDIYNGMSVLCEVQSELLCIL